ncbi:MAG TPA: MFS transporter [Thermomicrobiales bacterium]|nr:MFS transporter [Thermomicrobiales bacterium]
MEHTEPALTATRSVGWLVVALGFGVFFAGFDQTFVVTILPDMLRDLGIPISQLGRASWIVNGYLIGYAVALPLMGRIADAWGRSRIYAAAGGVYILGSGWAARC